MEIQDNSGLFVETYKLYCGRFRFSSSRHGGLDTYCICSICLWLSRGGGGNSDPWCKESVNSSPKHRVVINIFVRAAQTLGGDKMHQRFLSFRKRDGVPDNE